MHRRSTLKIQFDTKLLKILDKYLMVTFENSKNDSIRNFE